MHPNPKQSILQECLHINKYRCFKYDEVVVKFFAGKSNTFSILKQTTYHEGVKFAEIALSHQYLKTYNELVDNIIAKFNSKKPSSSFGGQISHEDSETNSNQVFENVIKNLITYKGNMDIAAKHGIVELETMKINGLQSFRDSNIHEFEEFKILNRGKFIQEDFVNPSSPTEDTQSFKNQTSFNNLSSNGGTSLPIYEDNPVSVIAYCLSSQRFLNFMNSKSENPDFILEEDSFRQEKKKSPRNPSLNKTDCKVSEIKKQIFGGWGGLHFTYLDIYECNFPHANLFKPGKIGKQETVEFDEIKKFKFKAIIYYPKQFENLRSEMGITITQFIRSLATSSNWESSGGKSSASFVKTGDEFFILKGIEKNEFRMFKEMAEDYFQYMSDNINRETPTLISKIIGLYEVTFSGNTWYYICMENMFHGIKREGVKLKVYDLKGSGTNRYNDKNKSSVLLDTNFLIDKRGQPVLLAAKYYDFLNEAVKKDTDFLEEHNRIDYSLLLLMDEEKNVLKMGIIDYLRLYTWDKQLETGYKRVQKLGAEPTIISPSEYKERFCKAMNKYFTGVCKDPKTYQKIRKSTYRKYSL